MIIPIRCFTCGKVSLHFPRWIFSITSILGCGKQMEQVPWSLGTRWSHSLVIVKELINVNVVMHLTNWDWRDTAAEECCSLMLTWYLNSSTTTVFTTHFLIKIISLWTWKRLRCQDLCWKKIDCISWLLIKNIELPLINLLILKLFNKNEFKFYQ